MLASKKTTDWVVQEGGASLSRALDAVHDMSEAAQVVEESIRSLDVKISNATKSVRRAIRKSGDISKRVNATRQSFGEAKSKYTSVERQWNLLEARRKRLTKPWNQQIQIDVSAIENQILKRKTNKKKIIGKNKYHSKKSIRIKNNEKCNSNSNAQRRRRCCRGFGDRRPSQTKIRPAMDCFASYAFFSRN
jgi:chromosome segregation ATPase